MVSIVQDLRILFFFILNFFLLLPPSPSVYVLALLQRETQDYSSYKKDTCSGYWLEGGQKWAVKDDCHPVDNKSRVKLNKWVI